MIFLLLFSVLPTSIRPIPFLHADPVFFGLKDPVHPPLTSPPRCGVFDEALSLYCVTPLVRFAIPGSNALLPPLSRSAELCTEYARFNECTNGVDEGCRKLVAPNVQQMYATICEEKYATLLKEEKDCLQELEEDKALVECFAEKNGNDKEKETAEKYSLFSSNSPTECSLFQSFAECLMERPGNTCREAVKLSLSLVSSLGTRDSSSPCQFVLPSAKPEPSTPAPMEVCDEKNMNCSCRESGWVYDKNEKRCKDVDECVDDSAGCSQFCTNIPGSFLCSCNSPWYSLGADNRTCLRDDTDPLWLFFAHGQSIWNISADGRSFQLQRAALHKTAMIDVDVKERRIYYADIGANSVERMNIDGTFSQSVQKYEVEGMEGIAVDWVGRNLYSVRRKDILVQALDGRFRRKLYQGVLQQPRAIALHPARGLLFVSDWSSSAFIAAATMDGTFFKKIITERITWPNALVIDIHADRIYWADAFLDTIEVANLDGSGRRTVVSDSGSVPHVFGMALADDYLYWTDWTYRGLLRAHKLSGENMTVLAQTALLPYSIKVFHPVLQPNVPNECPSKTCSQLCLISPPLNHTSTGTLLDRVLPPFAAVSSQCACGDGFRLHADGKTCESECPDGHFVCGGVDAKCITRLYVCDGVNHCSNGADEANCPPRICLPGQFQCHDNKRCVGAHALCDGRADCEDDSDETFCPSYQDKKPGRQRDHEPATTTKSSTTKLPTIPSLLPLKFLRY
ncbi:unnamed protein product, partial [Mesorhabditis belari]|uniref:EGF-like calcium-binding domain-containing protein n=1 Tax=Mesorhabditis belari TaxID=2138241 RepID=A0AAF3J5D8_9BILA